MTLRQLGSNQTAAFFNDGTEIFYSYNTPVAGFIPGTGYVKTRRQWSKTTSKHINAYLTAANGHVTIVDQEVLDHLK